MAKANRNRLLALLPKRSSKHHAAASPSHVAHRVPWWVNLLTDAGRPVVAAIVLIMCASGEHHLAKLSGWSDTLAWGMPSVLAAYAGIAAAVASKRPAGAPGKKSAVIGAWLALGAAMTAQGLSHAIVTGHLATEPNVPLWLVLSTSAVPPLVFGHLLHLAATPVTRATEQPQDAPETTVPASVPATLAWPGAAPSTATLLPIVAPLPEPLDEGDELREQDLSNLTKGALLTTREVANRYGVESSTVGTWKQRGKITPVTSDPRLGNLYDPETLPALAPTG